jgi:hypothetical protein
MTVAATMTENLTDEEKDLLGNVPEAGSSIGNVSLLRALKWPDSRYWEVRDKLLEKGILEKGRGCGGSVHRIIIGDAQPEVEIESGVTPILDDRLQSSEVESVLYEPVAKELSGKWTKDTRSFVFLHVPIEAENETKVSVETIFDECNRHGIDLIVAQDPGDYGTWDIKAQAVRRETDPVRLNDFIAQQLSIESKEKIQKWCR